MIPLVGARVRIISGDHAGKEGYAALVVDANQKLKQLTGSEANAFVKRQCARFGDAWGVSWYEAVVDVDGTLTPYIECAKIQIIETDMTRPKRYSST